MTKNIFFLILFLTTFFSQAQEKKGVIRERKKVIALLRNSSKAIDNNEFKKSDSIFSIALFKADSLKDKISLAHCYNHKGMLNSRLGNTKEGIHFHLKALRIALKKPKKENLGLLSSSYSYLANGYLFLEKYDSAVYFLKKAAIIYKKDTIHYNKDYLLANDFNSGIAYFYMNDFDNASKKLERVIRGAKHTSTYNVANSYYLMSLIKKNQNQIDNSFKYIDSLLPITSKNDLIDLTLAAYQLKEELYITKTDFKNAYQIKNIISKYKDSISEIKGKIKTEELKLKYKTDFFEEKNKLLNIEKEANELNLKKNKIILFISVIGLLVLLGFLYQSYSKNKIKKKSIQLLKMKNKN